MWVVPTVGAVVVMLVPAAQQTLAKWLALAVSLAALGLAGVLAVGFDPGGEQYRGEHDQCQRDPVDSENVTGTE
ncbi:hypothetical protein A5699_23260 [Mycobacterium sp. E802]|nr:hypothetical protein A5699_23260 [Mycobacterium sp. E802]